MTKIIWTNHASQRLKERKISENIILKTINSPDSKIINTDSSIEVSKQYGEQKAHAVYKKNDNQEFIVLSCWVNPPNYGSTDFHKKKYYKKLKKASGVKKFLYTLLNQLGF
jgi:hypothetical protein